MQIVFVSNYFNHHQAPFAQEMDRMTDHRFVFIETTAMESERKSMGWGQNDNPVYVRRSYTDRASLQQCRQLILEADVVIWGSCPFSLIKPRLKQKKLTFAYSERLFKEGGRGCLYWGRAIKHCMKLHGYQKNHYLLCASAYAAGDYHQLGLFRESSFKWGYFPEAVPCQPDTLFAQKQENQKPSILWVGRLIDWKHPEAPVLIARKLREAGYEFELKIIGNGSMEAWLRELIAQEGVSDCVKMLGAMPPDQVRRYMHSANIFLTTSDQNEGWGAVVNESMNSGCAVVASSAIGSAPFLIEDGKNGALYECGDYDAAYRRIVQLLDHPALQEEYGKNALHTILNEWNPQTAAQRLCTLAASIENKENTPFSEGICSRA